MWHTDHTLLQQGEGGQMLTHSVIEGIGFAQQTAAGGLLRLGLTIALTID